MILRKSIKNIFKKNEDMIEISKVIADRLGLASSDLSISKNYEDKEYISLDVRILFTIKKDQKDAS